MERRLSHRIVKEAERRGIVGESDIYTSNVALNGMVVKQRIARLSLPEGRLKKFLDELPEIRDWPDLELES